MTHHQNVLIRTVLMRGHNVCFHWEIKKLSLNYPQYHLLSGYTLESRLFWAICAHQFIDKPCCTFWIIPSMLNQHWINNSVLQIRSNSDNFRILSVFLYIICHMLWLLIRDLLSEVNYLLIIPFTHFHPCYRFFSEALQHWFNIMVNQCWFNVVSLLGNLAPRL